MSRGRPGPVETHGLTHVALAVRDAGRAFRFYRTLFGMEKVYHSEGFLQAQTPGSRDVLVFQESPRRAGKPGGVEHIGFRVKRPAQVAKAAGLVARAGGRIVERGEFAPGEPYLFVTDPDGYTVEIWYEPPTPVDPGARKRHR